MTMYTNDKGQSQSPVRAFPEMTDLHIKRETYKVKTPYLFMAGSLPIDTKRCQAPSKYNGSGSVHPALRQERCDRPATTVMVMNTTRDFPGYPDYILAYSCCDLCREHILMAHPGYGKFTEIPKEEQ